MSATTNTPDEFHGQGGEYVLDPATGRRTLVSRTLQPGEQPPEPAPAADDQPAQE
jgi:hypothetical protein